MIEVQHCPDTAAAQVHERLGLDENDLLAVDEQLAHLCLKPALKTAGIGTFGEAVDNVEPHIVTGAFVASARIAQTNDNLHKEIRNPKSEIRNPNFFSDFGFRISDFLPFYSAGASSSAALRPMTSGSAVSRAGAAATSPSTCGSFTWTTTASASSSALTPSGSVNSRT